MGDFIPTTMERAISKDIVFRPIRSWHSNTYAGEGLAIINNDRSGCVDANGLCRKPSTVTHRIYWNTITKEEVSAFLSYPHGMGAVSSYFWEIYNYKSGACERFNSESEMETRIISILTEFVDVQ